MPLILIFDMALRDAGWEGTNCDVISDDCIDNACTNGATCEDGRRQYSCKCPLGFTGIFFG